MKDQNRIRYLEKQLDRMVMAESEDKKTRENKWKPRKLDSLYKKANKKPEYVLIQYLRNNHQMEFKISKVISGNIVVIDNKGHTLNPKMVWRHGKYFWYIVGEWDKEPIGPRYFERIRKLERSTDNHPILMKMVLGAIQKKDEMKSKIKIGWIIGLAAVGILLFILFG